MADKKNIKIIDDIYLMKKLLITSWTLFLLGLALRLLHLPGGAILAILGTLLLFIHSVVFLSKNAKSDLPNSFLHLSFSFLTIYLLCRIQYWSCGPMLFGYSLLFIITFLITLTCFILFAYKKMKIKLSQIILTMYFLFFLSLANVHSDRVFYFFNFSKALNGESKTHDFYTWDKYSWFLYLVDKQDEAIEANQNAQKAVDEYLKTTEDREATEFSKLITQHGQQIKDKNWTTYP